MEADLPRDSSCCPAAPPSPRAAAGRGGEPPTPCGRATAAPAASCTPASIACLDCCCRRRVSVDTADSGRRCRRLLPPDRCPPCPTALADATPRSERDLRTGDRPRACATTMCEGTVADTRERRCCSRRCRSALAVRSTVCACSGETGPRAAVADPWGCSPRASESPTPTPSCAPPSLTRASERRYTLHGRTRAPAPPPECPPAPVVNSAPGTATCTAVPRPADSARWLAAFPIPATPGAGPSYA